jgi:DNA-binding PadR family transcriptional regulator
MKEIAAHCRTPLSEQEVQEAEDRLWNRLKSEADSRDLAYRSLYGDGWTVPRLDERDLWIVSVVNLMAEPATAQNIERTIEKWGGPYVIAAHRLERLEAQGLLSSDAAGDVSERRYQVTEDGHGALKRAKAERRELVVARRPTENEEKAPAFGGLAADFAGKGPANE